MKAEAADKAASHLNTAGADRPARAGFHGNLSYRIGWTLFRALFRLYFRWRKCNPERVPDRGPAILAANHASFLDPPLVGAPLHRAVSYLARDTLFRLPGVGWLLRSWQAVPVDRSGAGGAGLKAVLDRLRAGHAVVLFPEGTRSPDGRIQRARSGIGLLVIKTDAPVIPVRIFGTFEAFGRGRRLPRPRRVIVKYGHPLDFSDLRAEAAAASPARLKAIYQEIANRIMEAIASLQPAEDKTRFPG